MVEAAAEANEELMEKYLEEGDLSEAEIREGIPSAYAGQRNCSALLCGSAFKNKGVQAMLDAVIEIMPAPDRCACRSRASSRTDETEASAHVDDDAPFAALAFKIATDPFVGTLTFFRVYSGVLKSGDYGVTTRSRARRSALAVSCRCTPIRAKRSRKCGLETSPPPSV